MTKYGLMVIEIRQIYAEGTYETVMAFAKRLIESSVLNFFRTLLSFNYDLTIFFCKVSIALKHLLRYTVDYDN